MAISETNAAHPYLVEPAGGEVVMEGPLGVITKVPGDRDQRRHLDRRAPGRAPAARAATRPPGP